MKTHPTLGAEIISPDYLDADIFQTARIIALHHHEKWDGTGYPQGLRGDDIPASGRIVAVADVFDALTTQRPYKGAWSLEKAIALLKAESGKHFEPKLVDLFIERMPEILEIRSRWQESAP